MESIDFEKEMVVMSGSWPSLDDKQLHAHRLFARSLTHSLSHGICGLEQGTRRAGQTRCASRSLTGLWRPGTTRQDGLAAEATRAWVPRLHTHACCMGATV